MRELLYKSKKQVHILLTEKATSEYEIRLTYPTPGSCTPLGGIKVHTYTCKFINI
jgi:hypothetical protein